MRHGGGNESLGAAARGPAPVCSPPAGEWQGDAVRALVAAALTDPDTTWTMGGFGALATFRRDPREPTRTVAGAPGLGTARGGIRLDPAGAVPVAYETAFAGGWSHAVALCLPAARCPRGGAGPVTELGDDPGALDPRKAGDNRFDLGLDLPQGRFHLRTRDPRVLAVLRARVGRRLPDDPAAIAALLADPAVDSVVTTPLGRIEVRGGVGSGSEPVAFLMPALLALRRVKAATATIPAGLIPVASLVPPHPCRSSGGRRSFDPGRHTAFQALLARWGDPALVALKARLAAGAPLAVDEANRATRNVARVVGEQARAMTEVGAPKSPDDTPR